MHPLYPFPDSSSVMSLSVPVLLPGTVHTQGKGVTSLWPQELGSPAVTQAQGEVSVTGASGRDCSLCQRRPTQVLSFSNPRCLGKPLGFVSPQITDTGDSGFLVLASRQGSNPFTEKELKQHFRASCSLKWHLERKGLHLTSALPARRDTITEHGSGLHSQSCPSQYPVWANLRVTGSGRKTMTDLTVTLSFSLIGMTTQLNRAVMTRSLFLEAPHGIHAHGGFCITWVRGHSQNAEANTRLQMLQPPELAGCSAVCYTNSPTAALEMGGLLWAGIGAEGQAAWWRLPSPGPCRLPSSAAPLPSWPGRCWWCCYWACLPSSCGP